jgi:hypothetical protein
MTLQEIEELAGHRKVSPWVVKLVADAVAKEREACAKIIYDSWESTTAGEGIPEDWLLTLAELIKARWQA